MELLQNNNKEREEVLKAYSEIIRSIAETNLVFGISISETVKILQQELISISRKRNPGWKNTKIGTTTGIDRKLIPQIENANVHVTEWAPLLRVVYHFKKVLGDGKTDSIKIRGEYSSLKTIVDQEFKGQHSYKSILEEGVEKGIFKIEGDSVRMASKTLQCDANAKEFLEYLGSQFQLYIQTAEYNFYETDKDKKKTQNGNWSANIPEKYHAQVEADIRKITNTAKEQSLEVLENWENKVAKLEGVRKNNIGTHPKIGIAFNAFNARKHGDECLINIDKKNG